MTGKENTTAAAVIGGGAGGLCAAIAAASEGARVIVLEKANRVGKKLLKTGNGRCNLSNLHVSPAGYNHPEFVAPVLAEISCEKLLDTFSRLGLWTVWDEEGRVYPRSNTAASVLDVLRLAVAARGGEERCSWEAAAIAPDARGGYTIRSREGDCLTAEKVIVASGGGTALLRPLGHALVPFAPVLCPLKTDTAPIRGLSGLRVRCTATLWRRGERVTAETGEVLFRDFGLSGIPALDLSRYARAGDTLSLNLLPELTEAELRDRLEGQRALGRAPGELLTGVFHRRVAEALLRTAGGEELRALGRIIRDFRLTVEGPGDVQNAQVTRGGAETGAFDPRTLESRLHPGLYCVGEALDVDGRCGGYNLHWAFASGLTAGRSAGA